jgi:hypothetical protein
MEQQIREQQPREQQPMEPVNSMTMQYTPAHLSPNIDLSIIEQLFITYIEILIEPRISEIHRLIDVEP